MYIKSLREFNAVLIDGNASKSSYVETRWVIFLSLPNHILDISYFKTQPIIFWVEPRHIWQSVVKMSRYMIHILFELYLILFLLKTTRKELTLTYIHTDNIIIPRVILKECPIARWRLWSMASVSTEKLLPLHI